MTYKLTKTSPISGKEHTMELDITETDYFNWMTGKSGLIQNAFPHLTADEREFLITGMAPGEWDELFGDEEETRGAGA